MYNVYNDNLYLFSEKDLSVLYSLLKPLDKCTIYNSKWGSGRVIKDNNRIVTKYFDTIVPLDAMLITTVLKAYYRRKLEAVIT